MATIKALYGTEAQAITCTIASLASSSTAGRESTAIDNTTNLFLDALVQVSVKTAAGALGNDKAVYVYVAGTVDAATPTWPDNVTGADAAITLVNPTELKLLGTIFCPASSTTYKGGPWSVAEKFGMWLPEKWSIVVVNFTGQALDATEGNHKKIYQGLQAQSV